MQHVEKISCASQALTDGCPSLGRWAQQSLHTSSRSFASGDIALDMEHATGLERQAHMTRTGSEQLACTDSYPLNKRLPLQAVPCPV